jgi:cobalamin biosynthetic protein CobC
MDKNMTLITTPSTQTSAPNTLQEQALVHGGQLSNMARRYQIEEKDWLDLSTGIAPIAYPVGILPSACWQRLPQHNERLLQAARRYYQTPNVLPTPGSQSIIQMLPQFCSTRGFARSKVWLPKVGYQEHRKAWQKAGYQTIDYTDINELDQIKPKDIVLLINPNNPTGALYSKEHVCQLLEEIHSKQGLLIIDEAFMDATGQQSMAQELGRRNRATSNPALSTETSSSSDYADNTDKSEALIILRSVGKFFGLAGVRLGFVLASESWLSAMSSSLGPWAVSGPAQFVGERALTDHRWQEEQRIVLTRLSSALETVLTQAFAQPVQGTSLFKTVRTPQAPAIFEALCQQGIYVRLCDEKDALRFGIPHEQGLKRLEDTLHTAPLQQLLLPCS